MYARESMGVATRELRACAALLVTLVTASGCGRSESEPPSPRLVLLFATCSVSRHHLGPYNPAVRYTPQLSAFAREGTVFQRHQTEAGQSGVAYASIMTGTQADQHGVYRHPWRLRDDVYLLAEAFADEGYETHFWSGHPMASADLNYGQGVRPANVHVRRWRQADVDSLTANDAEMGAILDRLKAQRSYRAFVQVCFTLTHSPYTDVDPEAVADFRRGFPDEWPDLPDDEVARWARRYQRHMRRLEWDFPNVIRERNRSEEDVRRLALSAEAHYKASIHLLDRLFGKLVQSIRAAGLLEDSLIAFTADHGETLLRNHQLFKWTHGLQLSPDVIQVPLIVRLPARRGVERYVGVSRSIDLYPTLLGLAGLPVPEGKGIAGVDLSAAVLGRESPPTLRAFSHTMPLTPELVAEFDGWLVSRIHPSTDVGLVWTAVRDGDTYARLRRSEDGQWIKEAFDLEDDPAAERDLFDPSIRLHGELARELESYKRHLVDRHSEHQHEQTLHEEEVKARLRALGYIQ